MKIQRRFKDLGIGGITARSYDNNTRKTRLAEMKEYAKEVAKHIQDGCAWSWISWDRACENG